MLDLVVLLVLAISGSLWLEQQYSNSEVRPKYVTTDIRFRICHIMNLSHDFGVPINYNRNS